MSSKQVDHHQFSPLEMEVAEILLSLPEHVAESERRLSTMFVWGAKGRRSALDSPPTPLPVSSSQPHSSSTQSSVHPDGVRPTGEVAPSHGRKKKLCKSSLEAEFRVTCSAPTQEPQLPIEIINHPPPPTGPTIHVSEILENGERYPSLAPEVELNMGTCPNPPSIPDLNLLLEKSFMEIEDLSLN